MNKRPIVVAATWAALQMSIRGLAATVAVEQIESYENGTSTYAPTEFSGHLTVTEGNGDGGQFNGITFHADPFLSLYQTDSGHANTVGDYFYGVNSPDYSYVRNVYNTSADELLNSVLGTQMNPGVGPLTGNFLGGAKVINNSYVAAEWSSGAYSDANRRLDFMINQADVVWVAAAVSNGSGFTQTQYLPWSNFDGLAVTGYQNAQQYFSPIASPGKKHADLSVPSLPASLATAVVSGDAAALLGSAVTANQVDSQHGVVIRSLLMAGADKGTYTRPSNAVSGAIDPINGAGQPNYDRSLSILQGGEKSLLPLGTPGPIGTSQQGWASGIVLGGTQTVVLFQSSSTLTGLSASLNWNVTSPASVSTLNTSSSALVFPNLTLGVWPVTYNAVVGSYALGAVESSYTLQSAVTGDNVQYLNSSVSLPAGNYAFVINGDRALPAQVGFSYTLSGSFVSQWAVGGSASWGTASNWTNSIPNGQASQVNLLGGTSGQTTITLDGDRTVGQITFNNANAYTIVQGTVLSGVAGQLVVDDTGDSSGTVNPLISVLSGNHTINAPVWLVNGVTANVSSGSQLTISGQLYGNGTLNAVGAGTLTLMNTVIPSFNQTAGACNVPAGATVTFTSGAQILGSGVLNLCGGTLNTASLNLGGNASRLNWSSGALNFIQGNLTVGTGGVLGANVILPSGRSIQVGTAGSILLNGTLNVSGGGLYAPTVYQTGGTLAATTFTIAGSGGNAQAYDLYGGGSNFVTLNQSGGTLTDTGGFTLAPSGGNAVTDNLSGGTFITTALKMSSAGAFNWTGGTLNITGSGSNVVGNLSIPAGGTLKLDGALSTPVLVASGGVFSLDANSGVGILVRQLSSIATAGGNVNVLAATAEANRQLIVLSALSFGGSSGSWIGQLDLANNDLDVVGGNLATLTDQLREGYNNGTWNGAGGLISTTASADTTHLTTLGILQNNQGGSQRFSSANPFDTYYPGQTDVVVKYTYYGDANLDGKVDGSDYSLIDNAYLSNQTSSTSQLTGWYNGDFNYDSVINGSDYTLIDNTYNMQGATIQTAVPTQQIAGLGVIVAVPEPTAATLMGISAFGLLSRRKVQRPVKIPLGK